MRPSKRTLLLGLCALALSFVQADTAQAQILRRIKEKVQAQVEQAITCKVWDEECIEKAKAEGKEVVLTDDEGNPVEPESEAAPAAAAPQERTAQLKPGEGAWANYDFIPGERVLFFDDFSRDRVGNFPQRLELLEGNMEVVQWEGATWLRVGSTGAFQVNLPEVLPERFTMEFDLTIPWWGFSIYTDGFQPGNSPPTGMEERAVVVVSGTEAGVSREGGKGRSLMDPQRVFPGIYDSGDEITRPVRVRLHADGTYLKLYLEENRVANVPNADFGRTDRLVFHFGVSENEGQVQPLLTNLSVNAGGTPMYDALMADGRFVTQGIFFDTGSDRLRAESTPTLKEIGAMLREHPDLRILVEGHTDSVGDDASNLTLSKNRAEAVRRFLVEGEGIAADRLESEGLGETRPVGDNATAEGRQNNRRVELVRLAGA